MKDVGQSHQIAVAQIVIFDTNGQAHGWEITGGTAEWTWTGVGPTGRSTANVTMKGGEFRRRSKGLPPRPEQGELE